MERDNRIELSPPPWQGGVLPLYESRRTKDLRCPHFITWRRYADKTSGKVVPLSKIDRGFLVFCADGKVKADNDGFDQNMPGEGAEREVGQITVTTA